MYAGIDRILLGRQTEGVETHRVQDVVPGLPPVARYDIGADIPQRVPDVQTGARGVRKHIQHVVLRLGGVGCRAVRFALFPVRLPLAVELLYVKFHGACFLNRQR